MNTVDPKNNNTEIANPQMQTSVAKLPWITPEAQEFDPNKITKTGFTTTGVDNGIYS